MSIEVKKLKDKIAELEEQNEEILEKAELGRNEQAKQIEDLEKENTELDKKLDEAVDILEDNDEEIKRLNNDVKFWSGNASNHLKNLQFATAENDRLKSELQELKSNPAQLNKEVEQALQEAHNAIRELQKQNEELKLNYPEGKKPQLRTITIPNLMTERDKQIIQQAQAHLEPLINTTTLRNKILETQKVGTKDAYWELHTDLTHAGIYLDKLIQYFQQDMDEVHSFANVLGAILRGEYLKNN